MNKVMSFFNKVFFYALLVIGLILLFIGSERVSTMIIAFASFFASIVLAWIFKVKDIDDKYNFWINLSLCANVAGEMIFYYSQYAYYDKVLHFLLGVLITAIVFNHYGHKSSLGRDAVFLTVLGCLGLWEIGEYFSDVFFGTVSQGVFEGVTEVMSRIDDTMQDLLWGSIGSWVFMLIKKEKVGYKLKEGVKKARKVEQKQAVKFSSFIRHVFGI